MLSSFAVVLSTLEGLPGCGVPWNCLAIFVDLIDCSFHSSISTRLGKEMLVSTVVSRLMVDLSEGAMPISMKILSHLSGNF